MQVKSLQLELHDTNVLSELFELLADVVLDELFLEDVGFIILVDVLPGHVDVLANLLQVVQEGGVRVNHDGDVVLGLQVSLRLL